MSYRFHELLSLGKKPGVAVECTKCHGYGFVDSRQCDYCDGSGERWYPESKEGDEQ